MGKKPGKEGGENYKENERGNLEYYLFHLPQLDSPCSREDLWNVTPYFFFFYIKIKNKKTSMQDRAKGCLIYLLPTKIPTI